MNQRNINGHDFCKTLCLVLTLVLSPALAVAHGGGGGKPVNLEVNSAGDALETKTASGCTGKPNRPSFVEPGCVRFEAGLSDTVTFKLTGNPNCDGSKKWKLDGVQLANVNGVKPDPWPDVVTDLDARAVRDFNVNPNTGWVNLSATGSTIDVTNRNISATGYHVWYRVRAVCDETAVEPIYLDPRFDNEGTP
jgi:hypothetical protein